MYSNKIEGPRRGRSFDSMNIANIAFEERLLNNEVRISSVVENKKVNQAENIVAPKRAGWCHTVRVDVSLYLIL